MDAIIITSEEDFRRVIRQVLKDELQVVLHDLRNSQRTEEEVLMTRTEIARFLRISLVTLTQWVKDGLPCIRKGGRVLFQKSVVLEAIKERS